jgi:S1-C subfamily serine protease
LCAISWSQPVGRISAIVAMTLSLGALDCFDVVMAKEGGSVIASQRPEGVVRLAQNEPVISPASIYKNSIHAVFTIRSERGLGSGFVFATGYIATNAHVVGDAATVEVEEQNGNKFRAKVVKRNSEHDFAILEPEGIRPFTTVLPLPTGNVPAIGEGIVVIGSPGGLKGTLTTGIVSQIYPEGVVQLNVSVNPGNSGGPVFDLHGRVFGIATLKYAKGDGIGFAIPISWVKLEGE